MAIPDWPAVARPRERLLEHGATALSDAELIAVCLRSGCAGRSAVDLAHHLIDACGGLARLLTADSSVLDGVKGLGAAKRAQLLAVLELAKRCLAEEIRSTDALTSPRAVRDYLHLLLRHREHEVFVVLFLDAQHRVIRCEELFRGTLTQTSVYPREVVKAALRANAAAIILAHNHPSGVAQPSHADELLTRSLTDALGLVDIRVLDHFIVAGRETLSFAEHGLL